jgi:hypothetical protein
VRNEIFINTGLQLGAISQHGETVPTVLRERKLLKRLCFRSGVHPAKAERY